MDILFFGDNAVLDLMSTGGSSSPEELLIELENALENGEVSTDEMYMLVNDYNNR